MKNLRASKSLLIKIASSQNRGRNFHSLLFHRHSAVCVWNGITVLFNLIEKYLRISASRWKGWAGLSMLSVSFPHKEKHKGCLLHTDSEGDQVGNLPKRPEQSQARLKPAQLWNQRWPGRNFSLLVLKWTINRPMESLSGSQKTKKKSANFTNN